MLFFLLKYSHCVAKAPAEESSSYTAMQVTRAKCKSMRVASFIPD